MSSAGIQDTTSTMEILFEASISTGKENVFDQNSSDLEQGWRNLSVTESPNASEKAALNHAALAVIPIVIFVAMGNILVIVAVGLDKKLRSDTNCFLSSLAVADLLVALTVMPPSLAMIIHNYEWPFSDDICGLWVMLDVFFSTSSILHLCMISLDRYVALACPFHYRRSASGASGARLGKLQFLVHTKARTLKRVATRIFIVWAVAFGIAVPIPILGKLNRENLFIGKMCVINIPKFQIFGSLVAFFLPLVIMFVMYTLTIRTLRKQAQLVSSMLVHNCKHSPLYLSRKSSQRRHMNQPASTDNADSSKCVCTSKCIQQEPTESVTNSQSVLFGQQLPANPCKCGNCDQNLEDTVENRYWTAVGLRRMTKAFRQIQSMLRIRGGRENRKGNSSNEPEQEDILQCPCLERRQTDRKSTLFPRKQRPSVRRITSSFKNRAMASITNEQRASKVLGLIFVLFCLFWCPFFITNVLSRICLTCDAPLMGQLMNWFVWVGYVSSGVNPIVYTMFSRRFRDTFYLLLKFRISEINHHKFVRSASSHDTSGASMKSMRSAIGTGHRRSSRTFFRPAASHMTMAARESLSSQKSREEGWLDPNRSAGSIKSKAWRNKIYQHKKSRSESDHPRVWRSSVHPHHRNECNTTNTTNDERLSKSSTHIINSILKEEVSKKDRRPLSESDAVFSHDTDNNNFQFEVQTVEKGKLMHLTSISCDKTWLGKKEEYSSDGVCSSLDSLWSNNSTGSSKSHDLWIEAAGKISRKNNNADLACKTTSSTSRREKAVASGVTEQCTLPECNAYCETCERIELVPTQSVGDEAPSETKSFLSKGKDRLTGEPTIAETSLCGVSHGVSLQSIT